MEKAANANADFIPIIILLAVAGAFLWLHFTGGSGRTRLYLAAALTFLAVLILLPSISGALPDWWTATIPTPKIQLGLDLQGGTHLLLEVKLDEAVKTQLRRVAEDLKQEMKENKLELKNVASAATRVGRLRRWQGRSLTARHVQWRFRTVRPTTAPTPHNPRSSGC